MCGIFGLTVLEKAQFSQDEIRSLTDQLYLLSETRGREASGLALHRGDTVQVLKQPLAASKMIKTNEYKDLFSESERPKPYLSLIGHSRLVTNGPQTLPENNQPIVKSGTIAVHNGIIVNAEDLWQRHSELERTAEVDTEMFVSLVNKYWHTGMAVTDAVRKALEEIEGTVSTAIFSSTLPYLLLATNTGSLFGFVDAEVGFSAFASERYIMERFLERLGRTRDQLRFSPDVIQQIGPGSGWLVELESLSWSEFSLTGDGDSNESEDRNRRAHNTGIHRPRASTPAKIVDLAAAQDPSNANIHRCSRCILPHTMPFIEFDDAGVCNYCRDHQDKPLLERNSLEQAVESYRRSDGQPDCIVGLSGGRDSCYGLHYIKNELGMNPIAFTYDWGMITDLGRRNQARLCGKLGVEHVIVSADIQRKRSNIQKNVEAWLRKPDLGLVPLFMAGDKQYYYHAKKLMENTGVKLLFYCENERLEKTRFKAGFCGVDEGSQHLFDISAAKKLQLAGYYAKGYLSNPYYLNRSLVDTFAAFLSSYFLSHDFLSLFDYVPWNEDEVIDTLDSEYNWEHASDTESTWRIGDGTAAFYNYIYYTLAGFSEHDTFRSNQIRYGAITREQALEKVAIDNAPRWETMQWYAQTIGFDLTQAIRRINAAPRLYHSNSYAMAAGKK